MTIDAQAEPIGKIGIVWGGDPLAEDSQAGVLDRFRRLVEALARRGVAAEAIVYSDDVIEEVRDRLLQLDGALVWVNPIMHDGRDRSQLDALLREVASQGVWVSTHPDVVLKMGTKEVLVHTRDLPWGTDTHLYRTTAEMREQLPVRLSAGMPRVLKQNRGNGGNGVWKVEPADARARAPRPTRQRRGRDAPWRIYGAMRRVLRQLRPHCGPAVPPRLPDGMVRCYLVQDKVAGFGHQYVKALMPPPPTEAGPEAAEVPLRLYYGPDKPEFQALRALLESEWVQDMQRVLGIDRDSLPLLWDADFLHGPKTESDDDTYVLCEINVNSVHPFPEEAAEAAVTCVLSTKQTCRH